MQSRAITFTGKEQVVIETSTVREPGSGEVVIKADKSLISSGTEGIVFSRLFAEGSHWDKWVQYPFRPGYSMVGHVVAVGECVEDVPLGARYALREPHQEYSTVAVAPAQQAGILSIPTKELYPLPEAVADEEAPWFGLASIAQNGVRRAHHELGDVVVIIGLGLLGQLVVQYARLSGARQIIAVDVSATRLHMAQAHGATTTLQMGAAEAREPIMELTGGAGANVVYDITGAAPVFGIALTLLRRFGTLVLLGDTGTPSEQRLTGDVVTKGLRIVGAHDSNPPNDSSDHAYWSKQRMVELFFSYLQRGAMQVGDLITHRYSPLDAAAAYQMLRDERMTAMGVLFDWALV